MTTISVSIVIQCPVEDVFAFVTDARNNPLWQSQAGLQRMQQTPEDTVGVGTRITEVWHFMGRTSESTSEVTEYEPNRRYTRRLIAGSSPIKQGNYTFEPVAQGTRWTSVLHIQANGLFAIAEPILASALKKGFEENMAEVKALLERAA